MTVPMTPENKAKCLCTSCPTYTQNNLMGSVFCATGESETTPEIKGCICPNCGVLVEYKLTGSYFCINGAAD